MKVPELNRALVLEDAFRVPDNAGGYVTEWQPLGVLWADIKSGTGRGQARNELPLSRVPLRITVRAASPGAPSRPRAGQRFREGTRIYVIRAVTDLDKTLRYLCCHAEEETAA